MLPCSLSDTEEKSKGDRGSAVGRVSGGEEPKRENNDEKPKRDN